MTTLRNKKYLIVYLILVFFATFGSAQTHRSKGQEKFLALTRNLPPVDKVELLRLKTKGDLWNGEIEATKVLTGKEANDFASLWRAQTYLPNSAICHLPIYGVKFYEKEKLLVYASICWGCNNIDFLTPDIQGTQAFAGDQRKGQQLLSIFRLNFPH